MRDISQLSVALKFAIDKKIIPKLIEKQRETAQKIWEDIVADAPMKGGNYISSIQISDTENKDNIIKTTIFSDLKVGGTIPKWQNVPLSAFLEWGTGPLGESSNTFSHGYPYTTDAPWNYETQLQFERMGTWGMVATPHFFPALQKNKDYYLGKLKEAFRE